MTSLLLAAALLIRVAGPVVPPGREAGAQPYDPFAGRQAAQPEAQAQTPGFHITVPMCREAARAGDPLAQTAECATLLKAAEDQAKACRQAFEAGDDKAALSAACRQAAGFR